MKMELAHDNLWLARCGKTVARSEMEVAGRGMGNIWISRALFS